MKKLICLSLLLGLGCSTPSFADRWDTLGGSGSVTRYSVNKQDLSRHHAYRHGSGARRRSDVDVNIIVGNPGYRGRPRYRPFRPVYPSAYPPVYPTVYGTRRFDSGLVFNSSLGFIGGGIVTYIDGRDLDLDQRRYERDYRPVTIIERERHGGRHISLLKDRHGACWERETDRHGRTVRTRVADYHCDF